MLGDISSLVYHYGGSWVKEQNLKYVGGQQVHEDVDIDFLSFTHMCKKYREAFLVENVTKLYYLILGETLDNGLTCMENDFGLNQMVGVIKESTVGSLIHIFPWVNIDGVDGGKGPVDAMHAEGINVQGFESVMYNDMHVDGVDLTGLESELDDEDDKGSDLEESKEGKLEDEEGSDSDLEGDEGSDSDLEDDTVDMDLIRRQSKKSDILLGMTYANTVEARLAIARYSIARSRPLKLRPNEPHRIRAKCKSAGCPFLLFMSKDGTRGGLKVKNLVDKHTCLRDSKNTMTSARLLATEFKNKIYQNLKATSKDLKLEAENLMRVYVSHDKCKRAKRLITEKLDGSYKVELGYLRAYVEKIKQTNPGTTVQLYICDKSMAARKIMFKRVYICFDALKKGWLGGCRPIIGLDGCHLKEKVSGQLISVVGHDANNQVFPLAWAVISIENKRNWAWFIGLLVKDLQVTDHGRHLTIISDMQKGLVQAVNEVLPEAEHRYCARHVYANWAKKWSSGELKKKFWMCAWSTYKEEFVDNLKSLGDISKEAATDVVKYNPQTWCKAFFSTRSKSSIEHNNMSESFNSTIVEARMKLIVSMLTDIRLEAMKMLVTNKEKVHKWISDWSPMCMEIFEENCEATFGCRVFFNGKDDYEIVDGEDRHTVYLEQECCSCRSWDLSGILCSHAICAMHHSNIDPKSCISVWYHKSRYLAAYEHVMNPMPGTKLMDIDSFEKLLPPPLAKMTGRPRKKRVRNKGEKKKGMTSGKLDRGGAIMSCGICKSSDHNRRTCPNNPSKSTVTQEPVTEIPNSSSQPPVTQETNCNSQDIPKTSKKRKKFAANRKSRRVHGYGVYIDSNSGNITMDPGMRFEQKIKQRDPIASQAISTNPDPVIRFPIPNERELRKERLVDLRKNSGGARKIASAADGSRSIIPIDLPFKPPGVQWKGKQAMTSGQLQRETDNMKKKIGN